MSLLGRISVITGANKGMGKAMTEKLGEMGSTIYMVCRDEKRGEKTAFQLKEKNPNLNLILKIANMGRITDIVHLAEEILKEIR